MRWYCISWIVGQYLNSKMPQSTDVCCSSCLHPHINAGVDTHHDVWHVWSYRVSVLLSFAVCGSWKRQSGLRQADSLEKNAAFPKFPRIDLGMRQTCLQCLHIFTWLCLMFVFTVCTTVWLFCPCDHGSIRLMFVGIFMLAWSTVSGPLRRFRPSHKKVQR